eukprot:5133102-Ditylum_brightwellii.AAC.1
MESKSLQGIAVGQNNDSDCMMMICPFNQRIYHTNNYRADNSGHTATSFNLRYDGDKQSFSPPELYPAGTEVLFHQPNGVQKRG